MRWFLGVALVLLLAACAPRDPAALRAVPLTAEEKQLGRVAAFSVPVPTGAQGVAYGLSDGGYSVSPLPEEARRRGRLRVTVGTAANGCEAGEVQVWVGTLGTCLPVPQGGYSMRTLGGGEVALNRWTPLFLVRPFGQAGPGELLETPDRSRWGVAAIAFTTADGEGGPPPGLPEPSSVLATLNANGDLRQP
ncbi:hypothetical protein Dcar01_01689 [Deinococcus carri]|uniref:Lipoprotein n=1 Tax=Deinococcus carri TaxID=1211323 RepID=A0ABP9W865_9DEIO